MFWLQDKSEEGDDDNCSKVNEYCNSPEAADRAIAALAATSAPSTLTGPEAWFEYKQILIM